MKVWLRAFTAIVWRDVRKMLRQRGRFLSSLIRPLIWLFIIGGGFGTLLQELGREGYQGFLLAGVVCMSLLFGSLLASLSLVYDKEAGVMRMLMVAPIPHVLILLARTAGAVVVGICHSVVLLVVLVLIGRLHGVPDMPILLLALVTTALASASMGTLIAVYSKSLENFAVIMNFFIFPVFFMSGALYPIAHLPGWLKAMAVINPFSYGVDLLKHALRPAIADSAVFSTDFTVPHNVAVLLGSSSLVLLLACIRFTRPRVFEVFSARLARGRGV
ncbi:MAG: ABC transporter permease [Candidatus Porifericomitaceae bacterium WSBS_2022_MAG_OTU9]